jgi:hypothetical protein
MSSYDSSYDDIMDISRDNTVKVNSYAHNNLESNHILSRNAQRNVYYLN